MTEFKSALSWRLIFLLIIAAVLLVVFLRIPKPCQEPLTYRLGRIDEKFGLSRAEFSMAISKAAAIWGKPLSRELFLEDSEGILEINLIYDYRQETADKLKQLNHKMGGTTESIEKMKMRHETLKSEHEQKSAALENDLHHYNSRVNAYNAEMESWNRQGGVPETHRSRLMSQKNELDSLRETFKTRQDDIQRLADEINTMLVVTNDIVADHNKNVDNYRDVGSSLAGEFPEGFFESNKGKQSITIYHFDNEPKLVRLLVHELGHALRLEHSKNPTAIMYRMNQHDSLELTDDDIAALNARCEGKH